MKSLLIDNEIFDLAIMPFDKDNNLRIDIGKNEDNDYKFIFINLTQREVYDLVKFLKKQLKGIT